MSALQITTLGFAGGDADHKVREEGGNNKGPRIREYLSNIDPPINVAAPWCAAAIQYWSDAAARLLGVANPLDEIKLEAYVQSYHDHFAPGAVVGPGDASLGDLVLFNFGGDRWNHIGLLAQLPVGSTFWTVEGNTSEENQRDGDVVTTKPRKLDAYDVEFIRWAK